MEKKKNDQVGDDAHGGREDLGPADRPERSHDETLDALAGVIREARNEGSISTPLLTSHVFIASLEAGASAIRKLTALSVRRFPIQGGPSIPWSVIAPCEIQAQRNHDQTLERLAERGGLDSSEACAVLLGMSYGEFVKHHGGGKSKHQEHNDLMLAIVAKRQGLIGSVTVPQQEHADSPRRSAAQASD